jgi:thiol-disulfide isomerase/thioredoxin
MKNFLIGVAVICVVGFGAWYIRSQQLGMTERGANEVATGNVPTASPDPDASPSAESSAEVNSGEKAGVYQSYSEKAFTEATGERLLFFHASWCPQCRQLDSDIAAATLPVNVQVFKVDYDSNQALRQKYGVTLQTTVVRVSADGSLLKKHVAYSDPSWSAVESALLSQ